MLDKLLGFAKQDGKRIAWEIALAILLPAIGWAVGYFMDNQTLKACQDERTELLKQVRAASDFQHSVYYGQKLNEKDLIIQEKNNKIDEMRKKMALDSADRMSLIDAMRAVNYRYQF